MFVIKENNEEGEDEDIIRKNEDGGRRNTAKRALSAQYL